MTLGDSKLFSMDPEQSTQWQGIGKAQDQKGGRAKLSGWL